MSIGIFVAIGLFSMGMVLAVPLGWLFIGSTGLGLFTDGVPDNFLIGTFYASLNSYVLMSIGFFVFAGALISAGGLADKIVDFSYALVGKIRGGMTLVAIISTVFMSALTGSSVPCVSALVPLLVPRLKKLGYQKEYTTAVLCSSSFLGYLIPPSVPALIYCLVAQQSVAAVFLSTVLPAILLVIGYAVLNHFIAPNYIDEVESEENDDPVDFAERMVKLKKVTIKALPALGCPLVILVGIYGGICTPNEAGAIAVIYSLVVGVFFYKHLNKERFQSALLDTIVSVGLIALLIASGSIISRYLVREGAAQSLADNMLNMFESTEMILLSLNLFLLLLGMFIEAIPILILTVPLVLPLMIELDVNLVHLGAIFIINIGLGVITPPFAMSLFVGTRLSGTSYQKVAPIMLKYLFYVGIPVLMLTTYIPALATWLPSLLLGESVVGN